MLVFPARLTRSIRVRVPLLTRYLGVRRRGTRFEDGAVGKAPHRVMCTSDRSGGVITDHSTQVSATGLCLDGLGERGEA